MSRSARVIEGACLLLPAARTGFAGFWEGFAAPWAGFRFMRHERGLWRYGLVPFALNLLITGLLLVILVAVAGYFVVALHPRFAGGWFWGVLEVLTAVAVLVVAFGLSAIAWVILQGVFCGHFYARLAEQVELRLGMRRDDIHEVPFSFQVVDAVRDAGFLAAINGGLLLLHCVPGIGSVAAVAGSYYFTCMTLGLDFFEHPLALRGCRRSQLRAFGRRHRVHTLGLGTAVAAASLVPVLSAVLLTTAVTGAVLLHRRLTGQRTIDLPYRQAMLDGSQAPAAASPLPDSGND